MSADRNVYALIRREPRTFSCRPITYPDRCSARPHHEPGSSEPLAINCNIPVLLRERSEPPAHGTPFPWPSKSASKFGPRKRNDARECRVGFNSGAKCRLDDPINLSFGPLSPQACKHWDGSTDVTEGTWPQQEDSPNWYGARHCTIIHGLGGGLDWPRGPLVIILRPFECPRALDDRSR